MSFDRDNKLTHFTMRGEGHLGLSAQFDIYLSDKRQQADVSGGPLLSLMLVRSKSRGFLRYEVTGVCDGIEVFSMRAEPIPGLQKVLSTGFRTGSEDPFGAVRDRALARAVAEPFFGVTLPHDRDDAVNALTYHLASAAGKQVRSLSDVWMTCDRGFQMDATYFVESMHFLMPEVIAAAAKDSPVEADGGVVPTYAEVPAAAFPPVEPSRHELLARMAGASHAEVPPTQEPTPEPPVLTKRQLGPPVERVAVAAPLRSPDHETVF